MSAYLIFNYDVSDEAGYREYQGGAAPIMAGGTLLVLDAASESIEGSPGHQTVVIEYPDKETARAAYESEAYQAVVGKRHGATTKGTAVLVDGFEMPS
jgi:uncharacterized protein (DUF1330 family)